MENGWRKVSQRGRASVTEKELSKKDVIPQGLFCRGEKCVLRAVGASEINGEKEMDARNIQNPGKFRQSVGYNNTNGYSLIAPELKLLRLTSEDSTRQRKLILHFDVRNTVLVADSVWSVNVEQALNSYLSGVTWGKETPDGGWEWLCEAPCLSAPVPEATTYYRHVERKTVRSPHDRAALRKLTGSFTQEAVGQRFLPHFRRLLKLLEWPHELNCELLTMYGKDKSLYHYLLPSFLKLIDILVKKRRRFSVIIRTYGMDGPQVLEAVEKTARGKHPSFPHVIPVDVHQKPGKITRGDGGKIQVERMTGAGESPSDSEVFSTERDIYDMLNESEGISGFVDHFEYWAENNFHYSAAKPIWLDTTDQHPDVHHIFFDDNIRSMDEDSIVNVRTFSDLSRSTGRSMTLEESAQYENACLVQANLLESVENTNYFLEKIEQCEHKYESILQDRRDQ